MSNNNNQNHKTCSFAEQAVSYLYGEIDFDDKYNFESHLKNCSTCAEELADFAMVRSSVLDWREADFSVLETPVFQIPVNNRPQYLSTNSVSIEHFSWFANLKRIFSFNPVWTMAALGILAVSAGVAFIAIYNSGGNEVADKKIETVPSPIAVSPTAEIAQKSDEKNIADQIEKQSSSENKNTNFPTELKRERRDDSTRTIVKVSTNPARNETAVQTRIQKDANDNKKISPVLKRKVPTLTDSDEDEDNSIRLADLFAEIDTK